MVGSSNRRATRRPPDPRGWGISRRTPPGPGASARHRERPTDRPRRAGAACWLRAGGNPRSAHLGSPAVARCSGPRDRCPAARPPSDGTPRPAPSERRNGPRDSPLGRNWSTSRGSGTPPFCCLKETAPAVLSIAMPATVAQPTRGSPAPSGCPRSLRAAPGTQLRTRRSRPGPTEWHRARGAVRREPFRSRRHRRGGSIRPLLVPAARDLAQAGRAGGVPVDDDPALRSHHHVPRMDLTMGDHQRTGILQVPGGRRSVAGDQAPDPGLVVDEQLRGDGCVRSTGAASPGHGTIELVEPRDDESIWRRRPDRSDRHPVQSGYQLEDPLPIGLAE